MPSICDNGSHLPGMWHDNGSDSAAPGSMATCRHDPCICTGYSDRFSGDAGRNGFAGLTVTEVFVSNQKAGTKNRNNSNRAIEYAGLLVAAGF